MLRLPRGIFWGGSSASLLATDPLLKIPDLSSLLPRDRLCASSQAGVPLAEGLQIVGINQVMATSALGVGDGLLISPSTIRRRVPNKKNKKKELRLLLTG